MRNIISYDIERDVDSKIHKYKMTCGVIHRPLKNTVRPDAEIKFYKMPQFCCMVENLGLRPQRLEPKELENDRIKSLVNIRDELHIQTSATK